MCMVMLYGHKGNPLAPAAVIGIAAGEIVGVPVTDQQRRLHIKQLFKMPDLLLIVGQRFGVFQIADMGAGKRIAAPAQAEGGLLLGAAGQHGPTAHIDGHGIGHIAAAAAGKVFAALIDPQQGIVTAALNGPVVEQKAVRHALQGGHGLLVIFDNRQIRQIGTGHHQRLKGLEQQMVQRCIRQHHAQIAVIGQVRHIAALFQQRNGASGRGQNRRLVLVNSAKFFGRGQIAAHDRQRLFLPVLAQAQALHGLLVVASAA